MAVLFSVATGNFTDASTWGLVDNTSYLNSEQTNIAVPTSYGSGLTTFTPGAITISGIAVKLATRVGTTGTISVALDEGGGGASTVSGTEVTINTADLPVAAVADSNGGWVFFKFASPVTLVGATAYAVKAKVSSSSTVNLFVTSSAANFNRALVTTATQAPVAGDDLIIAGEYTGQGTSNTITVTMNNTATTDYGSNTTSLITPSTAICSKGVLSYGTSASTNYYLKQSGHLIVYSGGVFNVGTTGTPIPRGSTATLHFDCSANVDFGLVVRSLGTWNSQGLSRTSGKNVVACKLTADTPTTLINAFAAGINSGTVLNPYSSTANNLDPTGTALLAGRFTDNGSNNAHGVSYSEVASVSNTTQVFTAWLAQGTGTNNRYVRIQVGNGIGALTNGFYADIDLQAGTIGTCTAVGNGTATSSSIVALDGGYVCTIIGKASSGAQIPQGSLMSCSGSGTFSYAGDSTHNFTFASVALYTASALPTLDLTVDTDTGWLADDLIAVAATNRTAAESELAKLSGNAGASTLSQDHYLMANHSGTSPTQAEVILLTRNIKICGTSSTLQSFVDIKPTATVDCDWTAFQWMGSATANKRGIDIGTTTGSCSFNYCSVYSFEVSNSMGFMVSGTTSSNITISDCVGYNVNQSFFLNSVTTGTWTLSNCVFIRSANTSAVMVSIGDVGGTASNITAVSSFNVSATSPGGINISENGVGSLGSLTTFNTHSNAGGGFGVLATLTKGITASNIKCWRSMGYGLAIGSVGPNATLDTLEVFGNASGNVWFGGSLNTTLISANLSGDTTFSCPTGLTLNGSSYPVNFRMINCEFGVVSGIKTAHTSSDFSAGNGLCGSTTYAVNCNFASSVFGIDSGNGFLNQKGSFFASQNHDQTAGLHKTWKQYGVITIETTTVHTGGTSIKMTPNNASNKLDSPSFFVAVASGQTVTPTVYVYEDGSYNGARARLIVKRNDAVGITTDTVLDTATAASDGAWEALTGTTASSTSDGVMEFYVDCDGTAGNLFVDSFSVA